MISDLLHLVLRRDSARSCGNVVRGIQVSIIVLGMACFASTVTPLAAATGDSFSFAVIADPHLGADQNGENAQRLQACVDWINAHRQSRDIGLAFTIGDIGDTAPALTTAAGILNGLNVPQVPLFGNHDPAAAFESTFAPTYQSLATLAQTPASGFTNWRKGPVHVAAPGKPNSDLYLQNFAFDYRGVEFVCPDWSTRNAGYQAELYDVPGGTWPWFTNTIANASTSKQENTVVLTHVPMVTMGGSTGSFIAQYAAFGQDKFDRLAAFLSDPNHDYGDHLATVYAGHWHCQALLSQDADPNHSQLPSFIDPSSLEGEDPAFSLVPLPGYDCYSLQACCYPAPGLIIADYPPEEIAIQLVTVTEGQNGFSYVSQTIMVPEPTGIVLFVAGAASFLRRRMRS